MSVKIKHACDDCAYIIEEHNKGVLDRYIVLETDEMRQLSNLIKEAGF